MCDAQFEFKVSETWCWELGVLALFIQKAECPQHFPRSIQEPPPKNLLPKDSMLIMQLQNLTFLALGL
jgi:hypothetical protein